MLHYDIHMVYRLHNIHEQQQQYDDNKWKYTKMKVLENLAKRTNRQSFLSFYIHVRVDLNEFVTQIFWIEEEIQLGY